MIKTLELENWKTHKKTRLEFEKGTNVIVGKMGSGKSSILDAISFALYGTFPSLMAKKITLDETLMAKPTKQDTAKVKLTFDYNGKEYEVERIIKRNGTNEGSLRESGKLIAGPKTSDVTKKISEIIESNYDLFSRAIYSEQNQIDFFLKMTPAQRKEKLDELLGLDKYEKVRSNASTLATRIKKIAEDKKKILEDQKKKNNPNQITEYEKRINEKKTELEKIEKSIQETETTLKQKETILRKLEETERQFKTLKETEIREKSRLESVIEQIEAGKKKAEKINMETINKKITELQNQLTTEEENKKKLEQEKKEQEKKITSSKEKKAAANSMLNLNNKNTTNIASLKANCPICRKPLTEHDKEKLTKELKEEQENLLKQIKEIDNEIANTTTKINEIEKKIKNSEQTKETLQKEIMENKRLLEIANEIATKEKQKTIIEENLKKNSQTIAELNFDEKQLKEARNEFYAMREKMAKERTTAISTKDLIRELEETYKRIKETQKQIAELENEIKEYETATEKMTIFTSATVATQAELRNLMVENINMAMEELWPKIYPYGDFSQIKIIVEEGSYEIMAKQKNNEWTRIEGILSGGERSAAAITIRIALSLVLTQNLGWIMLDEPTHNLDANSVNRLAETLGIYLPQIIEQIFIITHDKEMENAASGKLYIFEREKEEDGPTKINNIEK
jgi:exonuclease SbcC